MGISPSKEPPEAAVFETTTTTALLTTQRDTKELSPPHRDTFTEQPDFIDLSRDNDPPSRRIIQQNVIDLSSDTESDDVVFVSSRIIERPLPAYDPAKSIQQSLSPQPRPLRAQSPFTRRRKPLKALEIATLPLAPILPAPLPSLEDLPPAEAIGNTLVMFTDGSYKSKERKGGAGVAYDHNKTWFGRAIALGVMQGSDEAEMEAIRHALHMALAIVPRVRALKLIIQTDSESCLTALQAADKGKCNRSEQFKASLLAALLDKVSLGIEVKFWWVKGHNNTEGNERADVLARYGASQSISEGAEGLVFENPIRGELDRVARTHAKASLMENRDLFVTGATVLPRARKKAQRKWNKRAKRLHALAQIFRQLSDTK